MWRYLAEPEREHECGWHLPASNTILARSAESVRFRTTRDRTITGLNHRSGRRGAALAFREAAPGTLPDSTFEATFDRENWRIQWRILDGFEAGSEYVEELRETPEGTLLHVRGDVALKGLDWDQRLLGLLLPGRARRLIEGSFCRDYKRLRQHLEGLQAREPVPAPAAAPVAP